MANWQRKVMLNPEWAQAQDGELPIHKLAGVIASRLKAIFPFADDAVEDQREELVWQFEQIAKDEAATSQELDSAMGELFDWADTSLDGKWNGKRVCWIDTISQPVSDVVSV